MQENCFTLVECRSKAEIVAIRTLLDYERSDAKSRRKAALSVAATSGKDVQRTRALVSVLSDLAEHGWHLRIDGSQIMVTDVTVADKGSRREHVRSIQLAQREIQMRKSSVREFVREMERKRLGPNGWTSVFSLMRDGRQLAEAIRSHSVEALVPSVIDPYLHVIVNSDERCPFTGLRLMDVWRYSTALHVAPAGYPSKAWDEDGDSEWPRRNQRARPNHDGSCSLPPKLCRPHYGSGDWALYSEVSDPHSSDSA
jgi:hypothetical protein